MKDTIQVELKREELMDITIFLICEISDSCNEEQCKRVDKLIQKLISKMYE